MLRNIILLTAFLLLPLLGFSSATAQDNADSLATRVTGTVLDASTGTPIEGIKVFNGDNASTFTNKDGEFVLFVKSLQDILTISAPGYAKQLIPLKTRNSLTIRLYEKSYNSFQDDVNYEISEKPMMYVTQAIESKNVENSNWHSPGLSADHLMKGSFAGLQVQTRSGLPANGSNITMRGINSLYGNNAPLIVIDGMISEFNSKGKQIVSGAALNTLSSININDIENITILKDATSIYGGQGANGVIYIQTVKANEAETKIEFNAYGGIKFQPEKISILKADDYKSFLTEMMQSKGISQDSIASLSYMNEDVESEDYYRYHNETDWQNEVEQNGIVKNLSLKIKGGDNIALYGLSVGYMTSEGIIKNTDFERYTIRFNSNINISQKIGCEANISWSSENRSLNNDGIGTVTNPLHLSLKKSPFLFPYLIRNGGIISPEYEDADVFGVSNPVALTDLMVAEQRNNSTNASVKINYDITNHLQLNDRVGIMFYKTRYNTFVPHTGVADYDSYLGVIENTMQHKVESKYTMYNDLYLRYNNTFNKQHSINALVGVRNQMNKTEEDWAEAYNSPNDEMTSIGNGVNSFDEIGGYLEDWNILTLYANIDYDYQKKYFLTLAASLDGSSIYGDQADGIDINGKVFAFFPSATAAWLLSSENFMSNIKFVDIAKVRLGISASGNNDIGTYSALRYYSTQNLISANGLVSGNIYNPKLQWENNIKINAGLDLGLFNNRLSLGVDLYKNNTNQMMTYSNPGYFTGYDNYLSNDGGLETKGVDLYVNTRIINQKNFKWNFGFNLNKYTTTVAKYPNGNEVFDVFDAQVLIEKDQTFGLFYGYKTNGILKDDAAANTAGLSAEMDNSDLIDFTAGDVYFDDINGDNIINEKDKQVIGDPTPDFSGNVFTNFSWKGISLDVVFGFSYGNDVYNYLRRDLESMTDYSNQTSAILNRWRVQGQETNIPRAQYDDMVGNSRFSDRWIEDGSYIRLREITLSYNVPLPKTWSQSLTIFATGENLITFTNYMGLDPEFSSGNSPLYRGMDIGMTPQAKAVYAGIRIGL